MRKLFSFLVMVLVSITIASAQKYCEVIHLNNGSVIKGTIIEQVPNDYYKLETSDGSQFVYSCEDIAKITKEKVVKSTNSSVKYQGEVLTGFGFGVGTLLPLDRVYLQTIQGVRIGEYFSAGLGIGLNVIMPYEFIYEKSELLLPLYLNTKGYLPVGGKTSLFASVDIGASFGLTDGVSGISGFMLTPAVGVSISNKINISVGYELQKASDGILITNMDAVALKFGYVF